MRIVAPFPRFGEIRIADARRALGPSLLQLRELTVAVVEPSGGVVVATLQLTEKPSGLVGRSGKRRCDA